MKYQFQAPCATLYRDPCGNDIFWNFGIGEIIDVVPNPDRHPMGDDLSGYIEKSLPVPLTDGSFILTFYDPTYFKYFCDRDTLIDDQILIDAWNQEQHEKWKAQQ